MSPPPPTTPHFQEFNGASPTLCTSPTALLPPYSLDPVPGQRIQAISSMLHCLEVLGSKISYGLTDEIRKGQVSKVAGCSLMRVCCSKMFQPNLAESWSWTSLVTKKSLSGKVRLCSCMSPFLTALRPSTRF